MVSASVWRRKRSPLMVPVKDWTDEQVRKSQHMLYKLLDGIGNQNEQHEDGTKNILVLRRVANNEELTIAKAMYPHAPVWPE